MSFENRTVAITGAAGFLGTVVAAAFHDVGAKVVAIDVQQESLDSRIPGDDPRYMKVAVDLLDRDATDAAFKEINEQCGSIDALCAIAGGFHMGETVHETPAEKWELMQNLNVTTLLNSSAAAIPHMIKNGGGKIVTIGANAALRGAPGMGSYCAAKSTVMRLTESMSGELREKSINVNCVMPSIIDTPVNRKDMPDADPALWVAPADLASVIVFLCSDKAKAVHGALIPVVGLS